MPESLPLSGFSMPLGVVWLFDETLPVLLLGLVLGLGWLFLAITVLWGVLHALLAKPRWFLVRMAKGIMAGATLGVLAGIASWVLENPEADLLGGLFLCALLATSAAGWVGLGVAGWYSGYESDPNDMPL